MAKRLLFETDKRLLWKLVWNFAVKGALSVEKHKRRMKRGDVFPPFLYVSVINSCNLRCQGCWVDVAHERQTIDPPAFSQMVKECKAAGNHFFGIVGGEPFMHPELLDMLAAHPDCYFQVFTNGQFITKEVAERLRKMGNVTPLISVEGNEIVSDERRGRSGVFNKTMRGIHNCLDAGLLTGVCTSLCQSNFDTLLREEWIDRLIEMGVLYTWFHVYRPMGPDPQHQMCLTPEQQLRARKFVVEMRARKPIGIVDAYFDGEGAALCPAATGITNHVNPWGGIEPCPIVQFATDDIHDRSKTLHEKFNSPYLKAFRELAQETTRGCIVLERPDLLGQLVDDHQAPDATARGTARAELDAMQVRTSQFNPVAQIPEKNLAYRLAKRFFFNDFGVYEGKDHTRDAAPALVNDTGTADPPTMHRATRERELVQIS
jgi:MoaA/NifB/PqqE/SkfB family radical SAM enzyme